MILILIFIGVCVGIARDCDKINRETHRSRSVPQVSTIRRSPTQAKQRAHRTQSQTQYFEIQLAMCPKCEATILAEATVCPHCGSPQPICIVCHRSIVPLDSILSCPHCQGQAHRIHFLEYLKVKGTCPRCNTDLDPNELIEDTLQGATQVPSSGPQHLCMVCNSAMDSSDSVLQCPHCDGKAHRIHFLEYLKVKGVCPHCQTPLDPHELIEP
jgi:phage FluMu protein Com/ribosomal protein L32